MEPKAGRFGLVEIECFDCLFHVVSECFPSVPLSKNAFGQALGAVPAIRILCYFKNEFAHLFNLGYFDRVEQGSGIAAWTQHRLTKKD